MSRVNENRVANRLATSPVAQEAHREVDDDLFVSHIARFLNAFGIHRRETKPTTVRIDGKLIINPELRDDEIGWLPSGRIQFR